MFYQRALTIATLGLLSGSAVTIGTNGLIQEQAVTVAATDTGPGADGPGYRIDVADFIRRDDEEVLKLVKLIVQSGVLN